MRRTNQAPNFHAYTRRIRSELQCKAALGECLLEPPRADPGCGSRNRRNRRSFVAFSPSKILEPPLATGRGRFFGEHHENRAPPKTTISCARNGPPRPRRIPLGLFAVSAVCKRLKR